MSRALVSKLRGLTQSKLMIGAETRSQTRHRRRISPRLEMVEARVCPSGLTPGLGVSRAINGVQYSFIDNTVTGRVDMVKAYGLATDVPVFGDFAGTTLSNVGIYRPSDGTWHLDLRNNGTTTVIIPFGGPGWIPVTGDIDGNGTTDLGIYNPSTGVWQFTTDLSGRASISFQYGGTPGDIPLLADFNQDGKADPVLYNNGQWLVDTNGDRVPDQTYNFGGFAPGATPILFDLYGRHEPSLAVAAPMPDGSLMWFINPNRDGQTVGQYNFGIAGDRPLSGYFSTVNSLFVNPSTGADGPGAGTYGAPYRTINAAVNAAAPGTTIRLMAGAYLENVQVIYKSNLKFVGTGMQSTVLYPTNGDAFLVHSSDNISFDNLWLAAAGRDGRGLVIIGSSVNTGLIRTDLTHWQGVLATDHGGRVATLNALYSRFDGVQVGNGIYLQRGANAVLVSSSVSRNGLGIGSRSDTGGIVVVGNSTARIHGSQLVGNQGSNLIAHDTARVEMTGSYLANSRQNGAIFFGATTAILQGNTFYSNGTTFGAVSGFNGVEFYYTFTGYAHIEQNNFWNNTANGIWFGSAPNQVTIARNVFSSNFCGLNFFAATQNHVNLRVVGNYFTVPFNYPYERFGLAGVGSRSTIYIGGAGADQNIFENFPNYLSIDPSHSGGDPWQHLGCPNFILQANLFLRNGQPLDPSLWTHAC